MRDAVCASRPIGYFVHHQGRGHAERCAAILNALPESRPAVVFCADPEVLPPLRQGVRVHEIPSLFERRGDEAVGMDHVPTPETLHCAPLGWPGIRAAMGEIAGWFARADPALMICDVSAEIAQLCRICAVPHVKMLQHGERTDPGHMAAYTGAAGLIAPFAAALAEPDWTDEMRAKTFHAGGLGARPCPLDRSAARTTLGLAQGREVVLVLSGAGGSGLHEAPLGVGARAMPEALWVTLGRIERDWHATLPGNLRHEGWSTRPETWIAAADLVVASTGNTTVGQVLGAGRPWIAVPEWRYFDEQVRKAEALERAGLALHLPRLPASAQGWVRAVAAARAGHDPARQRAMIDADPAARTADWLETLADRLWAGAPHPAGEIPHDLSDLGTDHRRRTPGASGQSDPRPDPSEPAPG